MAGAVSALLHTGGTQEPLIPAALPRAPVPVAGIQPLCVHVHAHTQGEEHPQRCKTSLCTYTSGEAGNDGCFLSARSTHTKSGEKAG